jgi:transposase
MTGPATSRLVVFGIDPHKATHTVVAVDEVGRQVDQRAVAARTPQHLELLGWAHATAGDGKRVWAVEDCRQVSRRLERDLLAAGERIARWRWRGRRCANRTCPPLGWMSRPGS